MNIRAPATAGLSTLSQYHPVVIEGMGGYDPRCPSMVAAQICQNLERHWQKSNNSTTKPKLLIIQGDPLQERGISAITPKVANHFGWKRGLVYLDEDIADYHSPNADRDNVIWEVRYTELTKYLDQQHGINISRLEEHVDTLIDEKNRQRQTLGHETSLKSYIRTFALLQEVTKAACRRICGEITIAHTASDISPFSVTSFYTAGLDLGLVEPRDMVPYETTEDDHVSDEL